MGLFGNLIKGTINVAISPIVLVSDAITGDFENSSKIVENVIDSIDEGVEDLSNGDII